MSDTPLPGYYLNVPQLAGPQLLGEFLDWGLIGMLSVQVYLYHISFPEDLWCLRAFVYGVFVFEWVQTLLVTLYGFHVFVSNFGDITSALGFQITWFSVPIMTGIIAAAAQLFYAHRIWILSRSRILWGVIVILALAQCSLAIVTGIDLFHIRYVVYAAKSGPTPIIWLSISALVDVIIAVTMTTLLLRTKTGISRDSDRVVNSLVRLMIESGTVTAGVATVEVVLIAASPNTLYYQCSAFVLAKLYANTMIASLNNRAFIRHPKTNVTTIPMQSEPMFRFSFGRAREDSGGVEIRTETVIHIDVLNETGIDSDPATSADIDYPMHSHPQKCHTIGRIV